MLIYKKGILEDGEPVFEKILDTVNWEAEYRSYQKDVNIDLVGTAMSGFRDNLKEIKKALNEGLKVIISDGESYLEIIRTKN